jgi:hypothetical protein
MLDATPLLALYAAVRRRRLAALQTRQQQEAQLLKLVARAKETRFGRDHGFAEIDSVKAFQERVPLRSFEDFWTDYWKGAFPILENVAWPGRIPFFAVTSGTTTGVTKHIPCSREMIRSNDRATGDLLVHHLANKPDTRILKGYSFMLGGSTAMKQLAPGVQMGDLSGVAAATMPWWARLRYLTPPAIEAMTDWEERIEALAHLCLESDVRAFSGTPNWMLLFFDKLKQLRPDAPHRIASYFPNLELLAYGGINFAPYRSLYAELLEGSRADLREVYVASEGFVAVADRGDGEGLRILLDTGLFYELIPEEELTADSPTRHWLATAEPGVNYAIALSTCAGLWAYLLGDTVKLLEGEPPRLHVTGRISYTMSAFGEHLIDEEIEDSVAGAAAAIDARVMDFVVGAVYPRDSGSAGRHLFIVEFSEAWPAAAGLRRFAEILDQALCRTNEDYEVHRRRDYAIKAPLVHPVPPGTFSRWMKTRGMLGGQHKVARIMNDHEQFHALLDFVGYDATEGEADGSKLAGRP